MNWVLGNETDDVHVWSATLDAPEDIVADYRNILADAERIRADGFVFARDRRRFIVAHAILRKLLGEYLGEDATRVIIETTRFGKPVTACRHQICFNLSHAGDMAVFAFSRRNVGIDIEQIRHMSDALWIAERFFSQMEIETLRKVSIERLNEAFLTCWTRKEAYIKARGEGLSLPLERFSVSLNPESPALLDSNLGVREIGRWRLANVSPRPGYVGALAVEGRFAQILQQRWRDGARVTQRL